jgi:hypothetical protein
VLALLYHTIPFKRIIKKECPTHALEERLEGLEACMSAAGHRALKAALSLTNVLFYTRGPHFGNYFGHNSYVVLIQNSTFGNNCRPKNG